MTTRRALLAPALSILLLSAASGCSATPPSPSPSPAQDDAVAQGRQQLSRHLTPEMMKAPRIGRVPPSTVMTLTVGLQPRDLEAMKAAAVGVSDPASPSYQHYLTPSEFADAYGASPADYQAVLDWARAKNLTAVAHSNRLVVEVTGTAADVEAALHVQLSYGLRPDGTQFHAPDVEPSLDLTVPVDHIGNLENHVLPRPAGGSGTDGSRTGADFRHAYTPCTDAIGRGQVVGIFMIDGFSQTDLDSYVAASSLPAPLPVQVVPAGTAGATAQIEGNLDVQMVLSMAPGAQVVGFTGSTDAILANMTEATNIKQFTSSWFTGELDSTAEASLAQMALAGQSFFQASGDGGAYSSGYFSRGHDIRLHPSVTVVGGTALDMNGSGASYGSESAWGGSSGGVIDFTGGGGSPIPSYQAGLATSANQASSVFRNLPDVSAEGAYVAFYVNGAVWTGSGTSASTPLWAGFMALANERAENLHRQSLGFINPTLYGLARSGAYATDFNDITTGTTPYPATPGYDLATGLGSPRCPLIGALAVSGACVKTDCPAGFVLSAATCSCQPVCDSKAEACAEQCGGTAPDGCGGTYTCPTLKGRLCCSHLGGRWQPLPAPGFCFPE